MRLHFEKAAKRQCTPSEQKASHSPNGSFQVPNERVKAYPLPHTHSFRIIFGVTPLYRERSLAVSTCLFFFFFFHSIYPPPQNIDSLYFLPEETAAAITVLYCGGESRTGSGGFHWSARRKRAESQPFENVPKRTVGRTFFFFDIFHSRISITRRSRTHGYSSLQCHTRRSRGAQGGWRRRWHRDKRGNDGNKVFQAEDTVPPAYLTPRGTPSSYTRTSMGAHNDWIRN